MRFLVFFVDAWTPSLNDTRYVDSLTLLDQAIDGYLARASQFRTAPRTLSADKMYAASWVPLGTHGICALEISSAGGHLLAGFTYVAKTGDELIYC